ncbi:MAG: hypothetical protein QXZ68_06750 [Candidatus Bathyarchaeia archaeon]
MGEAPILTPEQYQAGMQMLSKWLKQVEIKLKEGTGRVDVIWHYDFQDEQLAKAFAEGLKKQFEGMK